MARLNRLTVAGLPHHVVWVGHNGSAVFRDAEDRYLFKRLLTEVSLAHDLPIHAYALLDTQVHLLLTPKTAAVLPVFMQTVGRTYVRRFNLRHARRGTLWEGRFRCTVLEPGALVLEAMVLFDTEAMRGDAPDATARSAWTSGDHYSGLSTERWLSPPDVYWQLGNTPFAREDAYRRLLAHGVRASRRQELLDAAWHGWPQGSAAFLVWLAGHAQRRVTKARAGRPPKPPSSVPN